MGYKVIRSHTITAGISAGIVILILVGFNHFTGAASERKNIPEVIVSHSIAPIPTFSLTPSPLPSNTPKLEDTTNLLQTSVPIDNYQNYGWYMHNGQSMQYVNAQWYSTPQQGVYQQVQSQPIHAYYIYTPAPLYNASPTTYQQQLQATTEQQFQEMQQFDNNLNNIEFQNNLIDTLNR